MRPALTGKDGVQIRVASTEAMSTPAGTVKPTVGPWSMTGNTTSRFVSKKQLGAPIVPSSNDTRSKPK